LTCHLISNILLIEFIDGGCKQEMAYKIELSVATSRQIEAALCKRLESIRLSRNITQAQLAEEAGVSPRTIGRLEKGQGVSLDTFIRIMMALGVQQNFETLLPDPAVRPVERIGMGLGQRKRARPAKSSDEGPTWSWGDGGDDDE
jgi:putative transcriptional regulator